MRRDIVVIGASAGGIDALRSIAAGLPPQFPASICVVLHVSPESPGILDKILDRAGPLRAVQVHSSQRLQPGVIYVAAPDHHLIVEPSVVRATRGPRENRFRPAIDPLFRSAAQTYGPRAIGIILTGSLDDGTAGLWAIKRLGGKAIVQDPAEALAESMPLNALQYVEVDHCVPVSEIPGLLVRLTAEPIEKEGGYTVPESMNIEVDIARAKDPLEAGVEQLGEPSTYACPECHGVLLRVKEGDRARFRCHTGHAYSAETLIAEFDQAIENALWNSIRALQEKVLLIEHLADHARERDDRQLAAALAQRADDAHQRAELVRRAVQAPESPVPPEAA
ncbi:MAG TPA: chemotaxis protein CheB [Alphaproteobacteria bacterium]|nr:chemotaxis protein CheB [Alphaproteobacteria bacterium]